MQHATRKSTMFPLKLTNIMEFKNQHPSIRLEVGCPKIQLNHTLPL